VLKNKSGNISETRKDRRKVTMDSYYGAIPTPYGLRFPKIGGSQPYPKTAITIISGTAKAIYGQQVWAIHSQGPSEHKTMKNFGENGTWAYPETAQIFLSTPYYLRNG